MKSVQENVKIKICGVRSVSIAQASVAAGADFIGLVFANSKRQVDRQTAQAIRRAVPPAVKLVGVFKDQPLDVVLAIAKDCSLDIVQLHGAEPPEWLASISQPVWRSVAVAADGSYSLSLESWRGVAGFLFDTALVDGTSGGAGQSFCWQGLKVQDLSAPLILAGGLNANNVAEAIRTIQPYAVDVSGGVELAGEKSPELIEKFIRSCNKNSFSL